LQPQVFSLRNILPVKSLVLNEVKEPNHNTLNNLKAGGTSRKKLLLTPPLPLPKGEGREALTFSSPP